jgi:protein-disulfide isomerase
MRNRIRLVSLAALAALFTVGGCAPDNEAFRELREGQREIRAKLADVGEKVGAIQTKLDKVEKLAAARPAAKGAPGQPDPNKVYDIPTGDSPFKGPADAAVVITEFSDFQCPFCGKLPPLLDDVRAKFPKDVKVVYKEFPLSFHKNAMNASRAGLAAKRQGKFWEMHDKMFENMRALELDNLKKYAGEIGLDMTQFEKDLADPKIQKQIDDDMAIAKKVGVRGTPTVFVNGKRYAGQRSVDGFTTAVEAELKKKKG